MAATVGLDIGSAAVRAAAVDSGRSRPVLRRFAEMPLPEGAVVSGEIIDEDAVTEAVSALWKRSKLPKKRVVIGTANQRVVVRQVDVPHMSEAELGQALPFQVQDSIPIPVEDAVLDFVPVEEFTTPEGELMLSILAVAAHREMVDGLLRVVASAGLTAQAVDLQPFALARAVFSESPGFEEGPQGIIDIGASLTQVVLVRGGVIRFVRLLPRGGADFSAALADGLGIDAEQAEEMKRRIGVQPEGSPPEAGTDEDAARRILTRQADSFIEEIRGSVNYHLTQSGDAAIDRLVVAGNGARLPHLANRLGRALNTAVQPAKILELVDVGRVQLTPEQLDAAQPVLPAAVGLALWGTI